MRIKTTMTLSELTDADFKHQDASEQQIIEQALEAAGHAIIALDEQRWSRFIHYCHTGRFKSGEVSCQNN